MLADGANHTNQSEAPTEASTCTTPQKRVEWRTLDAATPKQYTDAVLCLRTKPSKLGLSPTLYDDFTWVHAHLNDDIHFVAQFLPWHRYFVHLYERELKSCGYNGVMSYWDWTLDTANRSSSSIWDPYHGFGGDGVGPGPYRLDSANPILDVCVQDGPFANLTVAYAEAAYTPHCLSRNFNDGLAAFPGDMRSSAFSARAVADVQARHDYDRYRQDLEGGPHDAVHKAVGGELAVASSPNDPLFYLHHTQIHRLWWLWQQSKYRPQEAYGGRKTQDGPEGRTTASLDDVMPYLGLVDDIKICFPGVLEFPISKAI
ncbi:uncharacterized protein PG986_010552 [Apiospora aurea]|uniref:Tyrosinase copper-binding domain-containing protein n=1 Tax=Apiospora aurea TaxID=335848 RepID=A0ABR1Q2J4_9PEZI